MDELIFTLSIGFFVVDILESTSFGALNAFDQKILRQLYDHFYLGLRPLELDMARVFKHRQVLKTSLDFYRKKLTQTNPSSFVFLDNIQRESLHQDLLFTFYLLSAQFELQAKINPEDLAGRQEALHEMTEEIHITARFIHELRLSSHKAPTKTIFFDSKRFLTTYLNLNERDENFVFESRLTGIKYDASYINRLRSQWSRAGGLLKTILTQLSEPSFSIEQIEKKCITPSYITSNMAWGLYLITVIIDLSLIIRHTFTNSWMSQEEEKLPLTPQERFDAQWTFRKFDFISNLYWAIAFILSCFWLSGGGLTGYIGRILTMVFLIGDGGLAVLKLNHERQLYERTLKTYDKNIQRLNMLLTLKNDTSQIERLQLQLETAISAKTHLQFEWRYQHLRLKNEVAYAWGLVFAFGLIYCFLMPEVIIPEAFAITIGAAGTALYFLENLAYAIVGGDLHVLKSREMASMIEKKCRDLLFQFHLMSLQSPGVVNDSQMKLRFVEMKQLVLSLEAQKKLSDYHLLQFIRTLMVDTITPSLLFVGYIFLSIEPCLALTALLLSIAIVSKILIIFPETAKAYTYEEEEYLHFALRPAPVLEDLSAKISPHHLNQHGFFSNNSHSELPKYFIKSDKSFIRDTENCTNLTH